MISRADIALYTAKAQGRGRVQRYLDGMDAELRDRRQLEEDLTGATKRNEIHLVYQPQICLETGEITAFEALARWNHPTRGSIPPNTFIPLAEETRKIVEIGRWALQEACNFAAQWDHPARISVNVSPAQFYDEGLVAFIGDTLKSTGVTPDRLEIELTETVLVDDTTAARRIMDELHELGIRLALDDFGTGFSSLSYLREFPFDKIKIDQSFVRSMADDDTARAIIQAVIGLGQVLGMTVIAEGVEETAQRDMLIADGCDEIQGYLTGRGVLSDEVLKMINTNRTSDLAAFDADTRAEQDASDAAKRSSSGQSAA